MNETTLFVDVSELSHLDRQFLVERQLISREHADATGSGQWLSTPVSVSA
jgi:hypothetical protein